jgi:ABC-type Fe3+-hydroxamate transport system substrate-binding protein
MCEGVDGLGDVVRLSGTPRRVVSLVPSLTESVATSRIELLVGATDWCTHPGKLDVVRVGGTKNPHLEVIAGLEPDLVLANQEENRPVDIAAMRAVGLTVWVTYPRTVPQAIASLGSMLAMLGVDKPEWLAAAEGLWAQAWTGERVRAVVPIWRRPWMVVGSDTFAGDVLNRLGVDNMFATSPERYPRIDLDDVPEHDVVVLPDEPYSFSASDGPKSFDAPVRLVSGRHLTWYGPSLVDARQVLRRELWP